MKNKHIFIILLLIINGYIFTTTLLFYTLNYLSCPANNIIRFTPRENACTFFIENNTIYASKGFKRDFMRETNKSDLYFFNGKNWFKLEIGIKGDEMKNKYLNKIIKYKESRSYNLDFHHNKNDVLTSVTINKNGIFLKNINVPENIIYNQFKFIQDNMLFVCCKFESNNESMVLKKFQLCSININDEKIKQIRFNTDEIRNIHIIKKYVYVSVNTKYLYLLIEDGLLLFNIDDKKIKKHKFDFFDRGDFISAISVTDPKNYLVVLNNGKKIIKRTNGKIEVLYNIERYENILILLFIMEVIFICGYLFTRSRKVRKLV